MTLIQLFTLVVAFARQQTAPAGVEATTDEAFAMAKRNLKYLQRIRLIPQE